MSADAKHEPITLGVAGASIMGQAFPLLRAAGAGVHNLTVPGWVASPINVSALLMAVGSITGENISTLMDLFSNSSIRFEQSDGTLAMPVKVGHHYHLPGDVRVADTDTFKKIFEHALLLIKKMSELGPVHLVPPIPRYLSSPCCNAPGHCSNRTNLNFDLEIVGDLNRIREFLKKKGD